MISVILAAGYATRMYPLTLSQPKPLLPIGSSTILTRLMEDVDSIGVIERHVVISNHRFIGQFEQWAKDANLKKPVTVLDDGSTENDNRLGAVRDIQFAIDQLKLDDDLLVAAGDNVLDFSLKSFVKHFARWQATAVMCYREERIEVLKRCGVIVPDKEFRVLSMVEKPAEPPSEWAVPPFYLYARRDLSEIARGISEGCGTDAPGSLIAWLCHERPVYAMPMPGRRYDVGDLEGYEKLKEQFADQ